MGPKTHSSRPKSPKRSKKAHARLPALSQKRACVAHRSQEARIWSKVVARGDVSLVERDLVDANLFDGGLERAILGVRAADPVVDVGQARQALGPAAERRHAAVEVEPELVVRIVGTAAAARRRYARGDSWGESAKSPR